MGSKRKTMDGFDLNAFSERLNAESDRAFAILGAALLDAKLEELFRRKLRAFKDELLGNTSPIGTLSARIRIAYAIGWISDAVRFELDTIRDIRNDFAHSFDHNLSFADQSVADRCRNLKTAEAFLKGYEAAASSPNQNLSAEAIFAMQAVFKSPRWRYQLAVEFIAQHLDEIHGESAAYAGTDLLTEVHSLSANTRIIISATGTVGGTASGQAGPQP